MAHPVKSGFHYLIEASAALWAGDKNRSIEAMNKVVAQDEGLANRVFHQYVEISEDLKADFKQAKMAYLEKNWPAPRSRTIEAIEIILKTFPESEQSPEQPVPNGAIEVKIKRFYDLGFDPRYDFEGNYKLPISCDLLSTIKKTLAFVCFYLKSKFAWNKAERDLRKSILTCARIEQQLSQVCERVFVQGSSKEGNLYLYLESLFFNLLGLFAPGKQRLPSELLQPIHRTNKPPSRTKLLEENSDLGNIHHWVFARLNGHLFETYKLDRVEYSYVPHYIFMYAIKDSSKLLKQACRDVRQTLQEIVTDWKSTLSIQTCQSKLEPKIRQLTEAWQSYVRSHELLNEACQIYDTMNDNRLDSSFIPDKAEDRVKSEYFVDMYDNFFQSYPPQATKTEFLLYRLNPSAFSQH